MNTMAIDESCEVCRFWYPLADDMGLCRRRSPTMIRAMAFGVSINSPEEGIFPETASDDWCGEFVREATPPPPAPKSS